MPRPSRSPLRHLLVLMSSYTGQSGKYHAVTFKADVHVFPGLQRWTTVTSSRPIVWKFTGYDCFSKFRSEFWLAKSDLDGGQPSETDGEVH